MIRWQPVDALPLDRAGVADAAAFLARALADDPGWIYVFPDDATRLPRLTKLLRASIAPYVAMGASYAMPGAAGAIWAPPGQHDLSAWTQLRLAPRLFWLVGRRVPAGLRMFSAMGKGTPTEPHHYLAVLGVDPAHQGKGLGVAVLAPTLARCDDARELAWLESTNPKNHSFYRRIGFEVAHETPVPGGPTITFFARRPR
jgi:GNAT superfamily N-acetyltransferase